MCAGYFAFTACCIVDTLNITGASYFLSDNWVDCVIRSVLVKVGDALDGPMHKNTFL